MRAPTEPLPLRWLTWAACLPVKAAYLLGEVALLTLEPPDGLIGLPWLSLFTFEKAGSTKLPLLGVEVDA